MRRSMPKASRALALLWTPESGKYFVWAAVLFGLALGAVSGLIDFLANMAESVAARWTAAGVYLLLIGGSSLGLYLIYKVLRALTTEYRAQPVAIEGLENPAGRRGLILLVSSGNIRSMDSNDIPKNLGAQRDAISHHLQQKTLKQVWLLHTGGDPGQDGWPSLKCALRLQEEFQDKGIDFTLKQIANYDEPWEVMSAVKDIHEEKRLAGWDPGDIIADYTGMTKSASIGMILACLDSERPLQYIPQRYTEDGDRLQVPPCEIKIEWGHVLLPTHSARRRSNSGGAAADHSDT